MFVSLKLLAEFLPHVTKDNIKNIEQKLNSLGIEVERVITFPKINNLSIGLIKKIEKPSKDAKVNLCTVEVNGKERKIICGANNVEVNKKVIVANVGAVLPDERKIEKKEIMGVTSEGMLCGYNELNNIFCNSSDIENNGIILLDKSTNINQDPLKIIGLDDTILDLSLPSNRNDLNGLFWLAKELSILYKANFKIPTQKEKISNSSNLKIVKNEYKDEFFFINLNIDDFELSWKTKFILMNSGIVPKNNITDIGKVSQILLGYPIFCFDSSNLKEYSFEKLEKNQSIKINNQNFVIAKNTFVLKSKNEIVLIPGIGVNDKFLVNENSKNITFFASEYCIDIVNSNIKANKFMSEETKISSKELNKNILGYSFENLYINLSVCFKKINVYKNIKNISNKKINFDFKKLNKILSKEFKEKEVIKILQEFGYTKLSNNSFETPLNRIDILNEMDLIEDVLKIYGINNVKDNNVETSFLNMYDTFEFNLLNEIKSYLLSNGFYQIKTYNLCNSIENKKFNFFKYKEPILINNPLSNEREQMRLSLLNGVINTYSFNSRMKNELVPVFEIQDVYFENKRSKHLIFAIPSDFCSNELNNSFIKNDIFPLKEFILNIFKLNNLNLEFEKEFNNDFGCKNDSLNVLCKNRKIGYISRINPILLDEYKITNDKIYVCEISIDSLLKKEPKNNLIEDVANSQLNFKDLTFTVDSDFDLNKFYEFIEKELEIKDYKITSEYTDANKTSYSIRMELSSSKNSFDKIINLFNKKGFSIKGK